MSYDDSATETKVSLRTRIDVLAERHGGLRALGRVTGIDAAYLLRLRDGDKTNPSKDVLRKLGLKKVTVVYYVDCKIGRIITALSEPQT